MHGMLSNACVPVLVHLLSEHSVKRPSFASLLAFPLFKCNQTDFLLLVCYGKDNSMKPYAYILSIIRDTLVSFSGQGTEGKYMIDFSVLASITESFWFSTPLLW